MTQEPGMPVILATVDSASYRALEEIALKWFEDPNVQEEYEQWKEEQE